MQRSIVTVLKPYSEAPTLRAIILAARQENPSPVFGRRSPINPVRELVFDRSERINRSV